jgi:hypothetical protein
MFNWRTADTLRTIQSLAQLQPQLQLGTEVSAFDVYAALGGYAVSHTLASCVVGAGTIPATSALVSRSMA